MQYRVVLTSPSGEERIQTISADTILESVLMVLKLLKELPQPGGGWDKITIELD